MHNLSADKTIPSKVKIRYKNFAYFVKKLFQLREKQNGFKLNNIKEKLNDEINVEYKKWLLDRIIEIKVVHGDISQNFQ